MTDYQKKLMRMQDKIMQTYGFEAEETLFFCKICDKWTQIEEIEKVYKILLDNR